MSANDIQNFLNDINFDDTNLAIENNKHNFNNLSQFYVSLPYHNYLYYYNANDLNDSKIKKDCESLDDIISLRSINSLKIFFNRFSKMYDDLNDLIN